MGTAHSTISNLLSFPNPLESVILSPMASEGLKTGSLPQREGTAK